MFLRQTLDLAASLFPRFTNSIIRPERFHPGARGVCYSTRCAKYISHIYATKWSSCAIIIIEMRKWMIVFAIFPLDSPPPSVGEGGLIFLDRMIFRSVGMALTGSKG